jgi:hypothetical protein
MKFFSVVFGWILQGFFGKTWLSLWCFGGEDVVRCVVKVVFLHPLFA